MNENVNRFLVEAERHSSFWKYFEVKVVAVKDKNGEFVCAAIRVQLFTSGKLGSTLLLDRDLVKIIREVKDASGLNTFLSGLVAKELTIRDIPIKLKGFAEPHFSLYSKGSARTNFNIKWPLLTLICSGSSLSQLSIDEEDIVSNLMKHEPPYEGILDATRDLLGFDVGGGYNSHVRIVAPIYIKLSDNCKLEENLNVVIKCHQKTDLSMLKISVIARDDKDKATTRKVLSLCEGDMMKRSEGFFTLERSVDVGKAVSCRLFLYYGGDLLDKEWIVKKGRPLEKVPKAVVHEYLDPDFNVFQEWLEGRGKDQSADFERAIAILLHLCGFAVEYVGKEFEDATQKYLRRNAGVDVTALTPDHSSLLLCQCTTTEKIMDKLAQLTTTTCELRERMEAKEIFLETIPVIFTCMKREHIKYEVEDAERKGVRVICYEDLHNLLKLVLEGYEPLERTLSLIGRPSL